MHTQCQNCSKTFRIDDQDQAFYAMMAVPHPTFCPSCRLQRRLAWRNERALYQRPCDRCKKVTVCLQRPDGPLKMYCSTCWWSDQWNPLDFGRDYDFTKPFFQQFSDLLHSVPLQSTDVMYNTMDNSDFNNMNHYLRNCYLLFNSDYSDNCSYGNEIEHSKDCFDNTMIDECELCYECINCQKCYRALYSVDCMNSRDIWFSKNLVNCSNCIGCINLRNKEYCIFNEQYSAADYQKKVQALQLDSAAGLATVRQQAQETWLKHPHKFMHGTRNENVSGDYIYNSKDTTDTFIATEAENCRYCMWLIVKNNRDCYDYTQFGEDAERIYESMVCGKSVQNVIGGFRILECESISYSMHSYSSKNLFGCVGLKNKQYCILNKQYSKEQYEELVPKIIQQMQTMPYVDARGRSHGYGDYYPIELSPFAYNESTAYQFFPLTQAQTAEQGYGWKAADVRISQTTKEIVACDHQGQCQHQCTQQFKITKAELNYYQQVNIPLPSSCPNCRHYQRIQQRNGLQLWHRQCMCTQINHSHNGLCSEEFDTSYSPDSKEIVYCADCYQKEVY